MKYTNEDLEYLKGVKFSNGAKFELTNESNYSNRDDYLIHLTKNKIVMHLGFVDHIPLVDEKIKRKNWLHEKLIDNCKVCFGVDINKEGIDYIQDKYNYSNLYAMDIINDELPKEIAKEKIDYLLIPDVIEHIGNPVAFLKAIKEKLTNVDKIVLTTPNALRLNNFTFALKNIECINTDHRFWFTPFTLSRIVIDAGFEIENIGFYEHGVLGRRQIFRKLFLSKYFTFKDTLIIEIKF
ncbi:MAG: methyltransferase domain-containing protein [Sulfurovum sp.]